MHAHVMYAWTFLLKYDAPHGSDVSETSATPREPSAPPTFLPWVLGIIFEIAASFVIFECPNVSFPLI